jgi:hypothetical protein
MFIGFLNDTLSRAGLCNIRRNKNIVNGSKVRNQKETTIIYLNELSRVARKESFVFPQAGLLVTPHTFKRPLPEHWFRVLLPQ